MAELDRLSAQDASFLHLENDHTPMHVGSCAMFEGAPFFDDSGQFRLAAARQLIESRLHLVPRFRRKLMEVPLQQGRPVWVDDDHFDLSYHVRLTALPRPGNEDQLKALMNRIQAQILDRRRPLWELWFVEGLEGDRVAIIQKTHHALVDGISGVDVATVLLDFEREGTPVDAPGWQPEQAPTPAELLMRTVIERSSEPAEIIRTVRSGLRGPRRVLDLARDTGRALADATSAAPKTFLNVAIGPHRRFETARADLATVKGIRESLGGTVNDVVLTVVSGGLRRWFVERGEPVEELTLRAMCPVSVRDDTERMKFGNRVSAMVASLPIGIADPAERLAAISSSMADLKESGQAVAAERLMSLAEYGPPTILSLAARAAARQRTVNLVVTNVPGPQMPLYCLGAQMLEAFPYVGVLDNSACVVGVVSYDGKLGFGLSGDRDVCHDLHLLAEGIEKSVQELASAAGT
ncbi:MAG TPA: wax ester/triacylglycerol synthase family O-acyltransferase [Acidimicrobiales bacterium]|jgi:WS/DGAT/MGAT family acyltransferase